MRGKFQKYLIISYRISNILFYEQRINEEIVKISSCLEMEIVSYFVKV